MPVSAQPLGLLLRRFCVLDPAQDPALAYPVYIPGDAGRTLTFAGDGETIAIWTPGRIGRYRDFAAPGSPSGFSPLLWRRMWRPDCSTPLPLPARSGPHKGHGSAVWLGRTALIPPRALSILADFDTCYIGGSVPATIDGAHWTWASFTASVDKRLFKGVLKCPVPQPLKL